MRGSCLDLMVQSRACNFPEQLTVFALIKTNDKNMPTIHNTGRLVGVLFLLIFIAGVATYQFLQAPLFSDDYLSAIASGSRQLIVSVVLGLFSGIASIVIASLLLPIFKKYNASLAYIYLAFCVFSSVSIAIDNISVLSLLDFSRLYVQELTGDTTILQLMGELLYERHWWTHYLSLLISCFPAFILYRALYLSQLVPRAISLFGMLAAALMFTEQLSSILGHSISMNMLLPMGLVQLFLPLWLIVRGFKVSEENTENVALR